MFRIGHSLCIPSRKKGLKFDPQIFRERRVMAAGPSLLELTFKCHWRSMGDSSVADNMGPRKRRC